MIPLPQPSRGLISRLQESEKRVVRRYRLSHGLVGQDELAKIVAVEGGGRLDRRLGEARRFRIGIGIERRIGNRPASRLVSAAIAVLLHQHWDGDSVSVIATPITGDETSLVY